MCDNGRGPGRESATSASPPGPSGRARSDALRVGLIGGAGIVAGAVMGAISMFALLERDKRRAAGARLAPANSAAPSSSAPIPATSPAPAPAAPPRPSHLPLVGWDELGAYYVVQPGDHGAKIAALFPGADVRSLVKANPGIREWRTVQPGTRLRVPKEWVSIDPSRSHAVSDL